MFVYCINADDKPVFLNALTYNEDGFVETGLDSYDFQNTALPPIYGEGSLALPFAPSYLYVGPQEGTKSELLAAFSDPGNYQGSLIPYTINTSSAWSLRSVVALAMSVLVGLLI